MDNLTAAVAITLESDRVAHAECARIATLVAEKMTGQDDHVVAEKIGDGICVWIGERLSTRFDGAVAADGTHDLLWATFMGQVDWADIGKEWLHSLVS